MNELIKEDLENIDGIVEAYRVFGCNSDEDATECFRKINALKINRNNLQELADKEIERINNWLARELTPIQNSIEHFTNEIIFYYKAKRAKNPKAKVTTPYGKVQARKSKKWHYDEPVLMEYLKASEPEYIRVKEEIDKTALKKSFDGNISLDDGVKLPIRYGGEIVPGITITEEETITIKED